VLKEVVGCVYLQRKAKEAEKQRIKAQMERDRKEREAAAKDAPKKARLR
jgi:hypothetical protein